MAIPSFFKQTKPRGFNYVPRYYDPAKEEMEERRRSWGNEHRAQGTGQRAQSAEHRADQEQSDAVPLKREGTEHTRSKATQSRESGRDQGSVYRSKIMRGDMTNYFHRRKEQVERHTMIRILVIIIVMVLAIYLYLRF